MDKIGIIALLLAIPLSILANLLTTPVRNWVALLSKKWTAKRIEVLEKQYAMYINPDPTALILRLLWYVFLTLYLMSMGAMVYVMSFVVSWDKKGFYHLSFLFFVSAANVAIAGGSRTWRRGHQRYLAQLQKDIARLKDRLDADSHKLVQ